MYLNICWGSQHWLSTSFVPLNTGIGHSRDILPSQSFSVVLLFCECCSRCRLQPIWLRHYLLHGLDSVHLKILLMGMCRQCGSWCVTGHNRRKMTVWDIMCASVVLKKLNLTEIENCAAVSTCTPMLLAHPNPDPFNLTVNAWLRPATDYTSTGLVSTAQSIFH